MRFGFLLVLLSIGFAANATLPVSFLPQLHRPVGLTWERTDPMMRAAVVSSQTEILNYLFEHRTERLVVFTEANNRRHKAGDRPRPFFGKETPPKVRAEFAGLTFPADAERMSDRQQYLLFATGAAAVAFSLGWVDEMPVTESSLSQLRTAYQVTSDSLKTLYRIFRPGNSDLNADGMMQLPLNSDAIFDVRERLVLARVMKHAQSNALRAETRYAVIFGDHHVFPQTESFGITPERIDTRTVQIFETYTAAMTAHLESQLESQTAACQAMFENIPEDAGILRTILAIRKANKAAKK